MIKIVVEDRDERRSEGKVLLKRASALHLQRDFGDSVRKEDFRAVCFVGLRRPVVSHGNSVGLESQIAADFCFFALVRLYGRGSVSEPACPGWSDLKVLVADLFAFEEQRKFPLVRLKYAAGGGLSFLGVRVGQCKNEKEKKCRECQVS